MYSQTGWADWAEISRIEIDLRAVQKISSRSDTYGQFYRPIKAENTYYVFLLPLWNCTDKLVGPIELILSGSSKGWIWELFRKFRPNPTPMADFYRPIKAKNSNKNMYYIFLLPLKYIAKLGWPIELKFSRSSKGWI